MKNPWMPLYAGDISVDTDHLTATEFGIYVRLLLHCWVHGSIPREPRRLALISKCDPRLWHQYEETVLRFFDSVDGSTMTQKRVSTELRRCEEISNKRKAAAEQMHSKRRANAEQVHTHTQSHTQKKDSAGARETSLNGSHAPAPADFTDKAWEQIIDSYKRFGKWHHQAGPEPPSPSCRCPKNILARHGITLAVVS